MDKQQKWMVYEHHDNTGHNYAFVLFAESGGQTPGHFEGQNIGGNLKSSRHNFQLSDIANILVYILKFTRQPGGQSDMVWYYSGLQI